MKAFIGIQQSGVTMYLQSIAVSTSRFNSRCIHTDEKVYDFYKNDKDWELIFIEDKCNQLREIVGDLYDRKEKAESEKAEAVSALNEIDKYWSK